MPEAAAPEAAAVMRGTRSARWWRELRRRSGSGWLTAGALSLAAGLAIVAYLLWQFFGTNWISHRHQAQVLSQLRGTWRDGGSTSQSAWGRADAIIEIPRFGPTFAVPLLEGDGPDVLAAGFGHITGTAGPGQVGNFVIAGHRVTHGEPLRNMPRLEAGDEIKVLTRRLEYDYRLTTGGHDLTVPFTATWVTTPLPHNPMLGGVEPSPKSRQRLITVTTCAELFHTDNRLVAFGILVGTKSRTAGGE